MSNRQAINAERNHRLCLTQSSQPTSINCSKNCCLEVRAIKGDGWLASIDVDISNLWVGWGVMQQLFCFHGDYSTELQWGYVQWPPRIITCCCVNLICPVRYEHLPIIVYLVVYSIGFVISFTKFRACFPMDLMFLPTRHPAICSRGCLLPSTYQESNLSLSHLSLSLLFCLILSLSSLYPSLSLAPSISDICAC